MRTKNSIKNLYVSLMGKFIDLILKFISRTAIIKFLSTEYLGINGLFSNILSILSLAELGIGSAIVYSMYKPIANNDIRIIQGLMSFYKKVYKLIGIFIVIIGCLLTPFLNFFIKDIPDIPNLQLIYILFVLNSAVSYFYSYKTSFITANQKNYLITIIQSLCDIFKILIQTCIIFFTKNFIIYMIIQVIFTLLNNICISIYANYIFPFLKSKEKQQLDKNILKEIIKNTIAMICHKVGSIIVYSTDNIILSRMVGILSVGLYSNYSLIINAVNGIIINIFNSITASVGNLVVEGEYEKKKEIFSITLFVNFWIYSFCSICLFNLINHFIELWIGKEFLFNINIVIILIINFYISGMRKSVLIFKDAFGLFWHDRYKPLFEATINLVTSIIFVKIFGIIGVFIGTTISTLTTCFWIEPLVLYKYGFKSNLKQYFQKYFEYLFVTLFSMIITYLLCNLVKYNLYISFIIKLFICIIIPNCINLFIYHKSKEFKYLLKLILKHN